MTNLGHVDPNLVGAARLETAFHEREGVAEVFERRHMRDGQLSLPVLGRAAAAVAAISYEVGADGASPHAASHHRQIAAVGGVQPKLLRQDPGRRHVASEGHKPAGLPIDAVHGPHRRLAFPLLLAAGSPMRRGALAAALGKILLDGFRHQFLQRRLNLPPPGRPAQFLVMPGRCHAGGLVDHHHVVVEVNNPHVPRAWQPRRGHLEHLDHLHLGEPPGHIGGDVTMHEHMPSPHEFLHPRPASGAESLAEKSRQRDAAVGSGDVVDGAGVGLHAGSLDQYFGAFTLYSEVSRRKPLSFFQRFGGLFAVPGTCVIGLQWGDEAKGKLVDILTGEHDIVVRYAGGANAGHTVVSGGETWKLSLIPSGILRDGVQCVVTGGVVLDPASAIREIDMLESLGVRVAGKLQLSYRAHVVFPWHIVEDKVLDGSLSGGGAIGTTGRGIGPCYRDKVGRALAIRLGDLYRDDLRPRIEHIVAFKNRMLASWQKPGDETTSPLDPAAIHRDYLEYAERLRPFVSDTNAFLLDRVEAGSRLLFEGAQGALLDIDHGTFPYVTSSNSSGVGVASGSGVPGRWVDRVIGVVKAYSTRVGGGPLPTEQVNSIGEHLRERGREYGTVTKRPRRCGWFDAVATRYTTRLSGVDELAVMLLDVLGGLEELKICSAYEIDGRRVTQFPSQIADLERAIPIYETLPGWEGELADARGEADLPAAAHGYLAAIGDLLYRPVSIVSVGPDREQTILRARPPSRRPPWQPSQPSTTAGA